VDLFGEAARDSAIFVEARFGPDDPLQPEFMTWVRAAEQQVQTQYPAFYAEAVVTLRLRRLLLIMVGRLIHTALAARASFAVRTCGGHDTHTDGLTPDGHLSRDGR